MLCGFFDYYRCTTGIFVFDHDRLQSDHEFGLQEVMEPNPINWKIDAIGTNRAEHAGLYGFIDTKKIKQWQPIQSS